MAHPHDVRLGVNHAEVGRRDDVEHVIRPVVLPRDEPARRTGAGPMADQVEGGPGEGETFRRERGGGFTAADNQLRDVEAGGAPQLVSERRDEGKARADCVELHAEAMRRSLHVEDSAHGKP